MKKNKDVNRSPDLVLASAHDITLTRQIVEEDIFPEHVIQK